MTRDEGALFVLHYGNLAVGAALTPYLAGWVPPWTWLLLLAACLVLCAAACAKAAAA